MVEAIYILKQAWGKTRPLAGCSPFNSFERRSLGKGDHHVHKATVTVDKVPNAHDMKMYVCLKKEEGPVNLVIVTLESSAL